MKKISSQISFILLLHCVIFLFAQKEREKNIEGITFSKKKTKYKSKKENPAFAIMQEVWKRKKSNGLKKFKSYKYKEYEKIEFDLANIDSAFMDKKLFKKMDFIFDYTDSADNGKLALPIFLNEAIYENFGQNEPSTRSKRLLTAQKTSGFQDNEVITIAAKNLYRDINLYDNTINYFDIGFQSPVSRDGFSTYDYQLIDSLSVRGQDVYKIKYEPKRKDVLTFQGFLYISKDYYSVMSATLRSTKKMNVNFINGVFTEIEYDNPDEDTFLPKKIRTVIDISPFSKSKDSKSIVAIRTVTYSDYDLDAQLLNTDFERREEELLPEFSNKDDAFWENTRPDSLSKSEKGIYEMLGKLQETPKFKRATKILGTLASGYYNVGKYFSLGNIYSTYGYNDVEGSRIRLGARTFFSQNDNWRIKGYIAYGFRDKGFKYGAEAKYMFNKVNRFTIGIGNRRDIVQLGVRLTNDDAIIPSTSFGSSAIFSRGTNTSLSHLQQTNIFTSIDPFRNFTIRLDGSLQSIKSADEKNFNINYYDNSGKLRKTVNDSHLTLSFIARPGAKFSKTGVERKEHKTLAPTIIFKYSKGLKNVFNADYDYHKAQMMFYKPMLIGSWGRALLDIEAGKNFNPLPLALQNVIPGNQSYGIEGKTFSQLNYYEFVADAYATAHLEHHFNGKILSYIPLIKKLKLREIAFIRGAYGTLSETSKSINTEGYKYSAPDKHIYYEYGFGVENIGFSNLRLFRIDFNWRGNYLDRPNISKFGIKLGIQFKY